MPSLRSRKCHVDRSGSRSNRATMRSLVLVRPIISWGISRRPDDVLRLHCEASQPGVTRLIVSQIAVLTVISALDVGPSRHEEARVRNQTRY